MKPKYIFTSLILPLLLLPILSLSGCISTQEQKTTENETRIIDISKYLHITAEYSKYYDFDELRTNGIYVTLRISVDNKEVIPQEICLVSFQPTYWDVSNNEICHTLSSSEKSNLKEGKEISIEFGEIYRRDDINRQIFPDTIPLKVMILYNRAEDVIFDIQLSEIPSNRKVSISYSSLRFIQSQNYDVILRSSDSDGRLIIAAELLPGEYSLLKDQINIYYDVAAVYENTTVINNVFPSSIFKISIPIKKDLYLEENGNIVSRPLSIYVRYLFTIKETRDLGIIYILK